MLPDDLDKLLEPFVVLQFEGGSDALRGTGLGLHLVQRLVRLHGAILRITRKEGARILFSGAPALMKNQVLHEGNRGES